MIYYDLVRQRIPFMVFTSLAFRSGAVALSLICIPLFSSSVRVSPTWKSILILLKTTNLSVSIFNTSVFDFIIICYKYSICCSEIASCHLSAKNSPWVVAVIYMNYLVDSASWHFTFILVNGATFPFTAFLLHVSVAFIRITLSSMLTKIPGWLKRLVSPNVSSLRPQKHGKPPVDNWTISWHDYTYMYEYIGFV